MKKLRKKQSTKRLDCKHFCSCGAFVLLHSSCVTYLNAALINNFMCAINQMAMCNVKEVAHDDTPTDYYPTLQFASALWCFLKTFFSSMFRFLLILLFGLSIFINLV